MYVQENNEILKVETVIKNQNEIVIKSFHCWPVKLSLKGNIQTTVNTPVAFITNYLDWQDNPISDENRPIKVNVTGPGQPAELTLALANGQAEFDFVSAVAGAFKIRATAEFPCDQAEIGVVVS